LFLEPLSHALVYWPEEGSVSGVALTCLNERSLEVGEECEVNGKYRGIITAKGTTTTHYYTIISNVTNS